MHRGRSAGRSRLAALLLAALLLAGCGLAGEPPTPGGVGQRGRFRTPTPTATARPAATASIVAISPYTLIRTYADARGREIKLFYGRAVGLQGDWGWAHILGKHLRGEWRDGGPVTTFKEIGITTPEAIQEIIGRAVKEDGTPDDAARGRREYRLPVPNTRYEVLTVVSGDGAVITAYPDDTRGVRQ